MLKVGELARKTGLTVRTLHHYDEIGLLAPSARSDAGYRLYTEADIVRLHAIQALRQLGLSLAEIAEMLANPDIALDGIVARQMHALDQEIARAQGLRARLDALQSLIAAGRPPEMGDWLDTLESMATYGKYFSTAELATIFRDWKKVQGEWPPLLDAVRAAMERDVPADSLEAQVLAQRWMDLSMQFMQNNIGLAQRWGEMAKREPAAFGPTGIDAALIRYIGGAISLRMAALLRHLSEQDLQQLDKRLAPEWAALGVRVKRLMRQNAHPDSEEARALAAEWDRLIDRTTGHDPQLRQRFMAAYREEPLLRMGHVISQEMREFIESVADIRQGEQKVLDPHATVRLYRKGFHQGGNEMQANILQSGQASQTAQRVAIARAVHQLLDEPIVFEDPYALPILGADTEKLVREDPYQFNDTPMRSMRAAIVARSRLAEDELQRAVAAGVRQYVVLGAGLDTFSLRNPYQTVGLRTFEVDHPATQARKRALLDAASIGIPASATLVAVDFEKDALEAQLRQAGFRLDEPACFSWLGVSMYLSDAAVLDVLAFMAKRPRGSSVTFDYRIPSTMLQPIEKVIADYSVGMFAAMGEPWISAFVPEEFLGRLRQLGFSELINAAPADLNAEYFYKRKDGLQMGDAGFRFLRARV